MPFHFEQSSLPSLDGSPRQWEDLFGVTPKENPVFLLLCDPFSFSAEEWIEGLDFAFPNAVKVGGFASAAAQPGENALFMNREIFHSGLVGVSMTGDVILDTVVAQGCYPIGPALRITNCEENLLKELDGHPNHDSDRFQHYLGRIPLAGFFCNGEIGPVGGKTHLHGYTSCFGVFRAKE